MAQADVVVKERYVADMSHAVPIEPHAIVAEWQGDKVTVWSIDAGAVHRPLRRRRPRSQLPEAEVRVIVPHLGGGFGGKCEFHFEAHVAALARAAAPAGAAGVHARARSSSRPTTAARARSIEIETGGDDATARSSRGGRGSCSTTAPTPPTRRSSRSSRR